MQVAPRRVLLRQPILVTQGPLAHGEPVREPGIPGAVRSGIVKLVPPDRLARCRHRVLLHDLALHVLLRLESPGYDRARGQNPGHPVLFLLGYHRLGQAVLHGAEELQLRAGRHQAQGARPPHALRIGEPVAGRHHTIVGTYRKFVALPSYSIDKQKKATKSRRYRNAVQYLRYHSDKVVERIVYDSVLWIRKCMGMN